MTDTPKPPMVVWIGDNLQHPLMTGDTYQRGHWSNLNKPPYHFGPYVQLDQFLEAVESVADGKHAVTKRQYSSDFLEAVKELATEIRGKQ